MHSTSLTLLERLRQPAAQEAWDRFVKLYTPLLYHWAQSTHLSSQEAADLVQDVLVLLVQKLPEFTYDRHKSFRGWLRTVALNKWRENQRRRTVAVEVRDPADLSEFPASDSCAAFAEEEYRQYLVRRALQLMETQFQPATWRACWECVVAGRPAADVAVELGITKNAVYLAKSRVLRRLHQELQGLLE
ncbi:MAG TPA: sigma-70 family RNA polymerase sigma factor [Gemmataceae bacterium]|nr:sigma-70 family RNA polymerase sigma factor [Gemmataceae bacterium]